MNDKVIKKTQDTLGKVIKKPPLTEKLLTKPPFRFLHDIMTSVIKTTGFMKGLFGDNEMSSDNVKDKESKIAFLQKAIDMVSLVIGKSISARPSKVVAGHEPEKTNEFLQLLADAIGRKVDNAEYVERVLRGESGGSGTTKKEKPPSGSRDRRESSADRRKGKEKEKEEDGEKGHRSKREDRENRKDKEERKERGKSRDKERDSGREKERDRHRDRSKDSKDRDKDKDRERHHRDRDQSREKGEDREKDRERRRRKESRTEQAEQDEVETPKQNGESGEEMVKKERRSEKPRKDEDSGKEDRVSKKREETTMNGHVAEDTPPQQEQSRTRTRMARPSSARPAPPRVKKNEPEPQEVHIVGKSNTPNVIVDNKADESDDDDFITKAEDPTIALTDEPIVTATFNEADIEAGDHGGLVKKILETKKELEGGSQVQAKPGKKTEIERSSMTDATKRKEHEMVQKEIDKLRAAIQLLTRSANPLGKILDFVQEDLDSMQKELEMWTAENKNNIVSLKREELITEASIEPLKSQLMEIDSAIGDQLDLIAAVKANIIRNDDKIEKMLSTTTKS